MNIFCKSNDENLAVLYSHAFQHKIPGKITIRPNMATCRDLK